MITLANSIHQVQVKVFRRILRQCAEFAASIWHMLLPLSCFMQGRNPAIPAAKESFLPEVLPAACDKKMLGLKMVQVEHIKSGSFNLRFLMVSVSSYHDVQQRLCLFPLL